MESIYALTIALLPVAILIYLVFNKDTEKEPLRELWIAIGFGVVSSVISLCISLPFAHWELYIKEPTTIAEAVRISFFGAAIPEEIAKTIMLWLFMRRCREYDQYMDGIIYAVCISLGFAALENILYVVQDDSWLSIGIVRAFTAVPGHYCTGVIMGYYYSKVRLSHFATLKDRVMILLAPIVTHGIYDSIVFSEYIFRDTESEGVAALILTPIFIYFVYRLHKHCIARIAQTVEQDRLDIALRNGYK